MDEEKAQPDKQAGDQPPVTGKNLPGRTWTQRFKPFKYRRFSTIDGGGRNSIFFQVENAPGSDRMDSAIYAVFDEMKTFHGRSSSLRYVRDNKLGKGWRLPNDEIGRTIADIIDGKLIDLAERMEEEHGKSR